MTTAETQKNGGVGKDLVVYGCLMALAGIQFIIAYQEIERVADVCAHVDRGLRRGCAGASIFHAFVGRESRAQVVRR